MRLEEMYGPEGASKEHLLLDAVNENEEAALQEKLLINWIFKSYNFKLL